MYENEMIKITAVWNENCTHASVFEGKYYSHGVYERYTTTDIAYSTKKDVKMKQKQKKKN